MNLMAGGEGSTAEAVSTAAYLHPPSVFREKGIFELRTLSARTFIKFSIPKISWKL